MYGYTVDSNILLYLLAGLLNILAIYEILRLERLNKGTSSVIHRSIIHQRELAQLMETHQQLANLQSVTETVVHTGTATVRSIHKEIANIPFEILENISATRDTTRMVKGVHDLTADGVYASITLLNRQLGKRLRKQMKLHPPLVPRIEKHDPSAEK